MQTYKKSTLHPNSYTKTCHKCGQIKNINEFSFHSTTKDGLDNRCKDCVKLVNIQYKQSGPGKILEKDVQSTDFNNFEWQGGKYYGTIFKRKDSEIYTVSVNGKTRTFNPINYSSKEVAYKDATKWRNIMSDYMKLTKNKYKLIKINNEVKYIMIQLSQNYVTLTNIEYLDFIKSHYMMVSRSASKNAKQYCSYVDPISKTQYRFHRNIIGYIDSEEDCDNVIDHHNRYPLDNRIENLRPLTIAENNKNKTRIHKTFCKEIDGMFQANIVHLCHGKQTITSEFFSDKKFAKQWIDKICRIIDDPTMDEQSLNLKTKFEEIMKKYSDNFKWRDVSTSDNKEIDEIVEIKKEEIKTELAHTTKKEDIYEKFHEQIDKNYVFPDDLIENGLLVKHIYHNNDEYKFCTLCQKWISVKDYFKASKNWDGLDRRCRSCKKNDSKQGKIKKLSKDADSAHNKKQNIYKSFINQINPNYILPDSYKELAKDIKNITDQDIKYKYCTTCNLWKDVSNYYLRTHAKDGLGKRCKPCESDYAKNYRNKTKN